NGCGYRPALGRLGDRARLLLPGVLFTLPVVIDGIWSLARRAAIFFFTLPVVSYGRFFVPDLGDMRQSLSDETSTRFVFWTVAAIAAITALFGWLSSRRLATFDSELAIWNDASLVEPNDAVVQYNLGSSLLSLKRPGEALDPLQCAAALDPTSAKVQYNLAI